VMSGPSPAPCICPDGYVPQPDASNCQPYSCHKTCKTCSGPSASQCLTCVHPNAALSGGVCKCASGFFSSPDATNCIKSECSEDCKTCAGGSETDCMTCHEHAGLAGVAPAACVCASGFFPNPHAGDCTTCHDSCNECNGQSQYSCMSCKSNASLTGSAPAACGCDTDYAPNPHAGNCEIIGCHPTCGTCQGSGQNKCLTCKANAHLQSSSPSSCVCDTGYSGVPDASNCASTACDETCKTCSGATNT
jgi:proprotein convertase subtilisin/kexin type 5